MRARRGHHPSALRRSNPLTALPESFGQLTALVKLDLSQRSACAKVWRGLCAAVGMVRGAEWGSRQARQSGGQPWKHYSQNLWYERTLATAHLRSGPEIC